MQVRRDLEEYVEVPEGRLHFVKVGSGYPVMVFHAGGSSMVSWMPALEIIGKHFTCYGFEILGQGQSGEPPGENFSMRDHGRSMDHAMQVLNIHKAHFIGHLAGASLAIEMAASHPDRVDKLVVLATPLVDPRRTPERGSALAHNFEENGIARLRTMESVKREDHFRNPKPQWLEEMNQERLQPGQWTRIHSYTNAWYDVFARLPLVRATAALVMNAEHGGFRELEDFLVYNLQNASKVILPGVGHTAYVEDPEGFAAAVLDFLQ